LFGKFLGLTRMDAGLLIDFDFYGTHGCVEVMVIWECGGNDYMGPTLWRWVFRDSWTGFGEFPAVRIPGSFGKMGEKESRLA
jgi:hypothetical protein